jgi:hypothetical protein
VRPRRRARVRSILALAAGVASLIPVPATAQEELFQVMEAFEKVVTKAPYQAEAITEITQELADGNRIERRTTTAVYRDGRGRVRREIAVSAIGALIPPGDAPRTVVILDPASGVGYQIDDGARVARKLRPPPPGPKLPRAEHGDGGPPPPGPLGPRQRRPAGAPELPPPVTEPLGRKTIEGVEVDGTRTTFTIPAGEVGNAKPIDVVHERWFSPELQAVVQSRRHDPRFGTTTFRLTGIRRAEPDPALFEVPAGFTIREEPARPPGRPRGGREDGPRPR